MYRLANLRHHAIRYWVRVGMFITGTELGLAEVWDDYFRDNIPESWESEYAHYTDEQITIGQDMLLSFIQNDVEKDLLNDLFVLRR